MCDEVNILDSFLASSEMARLICNGRESRVFFICLLQIYMRKEMEYGRF